MVFISERSWLSSHDLSVALQSPDNRWSYASPHDTTSTYRHLIQLHPLIKTVIKRMKALTKNLVSGPLSLDYCVTKYLSRRQPLCHRSHLIPQSYLSIVPAWSACCEEHLHVTEDQHLAGFVRLAVGFLQTHTSIKHTKHLGCTVKDFID